MRRPCHATRPSIAHRLRRGEGQPSPQTDANAAALTEETQLTFYPLASGEERTGSDQSRSRRSRGRRGRAGDRDPEPLLTPAQILDLANVSIRSFRRWTSPGGGLEVVRLGRSIRVRQSAWAAFLHKQSRNS